MALNGSAAMLLSFDVEVAAIEEHDRWHTHEHLPERLSIAGFRRGTRWVATDGGPRYMVVYEVDDLATLTSAAYLERLDNPTPWTARMMPHYRGMARGLCEVLGRFGAVQGGAAALLRFGPDGSGSTEWRRWLLQEALPPLAQAPGLGSAMWLQASAPAAMTNEQRLRGADRVLQSAVVLTGYDEAAVLAQAKALAGPGGLPERGAADLSVATYRCACTLACTDLPA